MKYDLPEDAIALIEQFLRDLSKIDCAVVGMVFCDKPKPGLGFIRNVSGDPVVLAKKFASLMESATLVETLVRPIQ